MDPELFALASALCRRLGRGEPASLQPEAMSPGEEGFSGARLLRLRCAFRDGSAGSLVAKSAPLRERRVMVQLTSQGRGFTPAAWADPQDAREEAWLLLEDVAPAQPLPARLPDWKAQVAQALAALHGDNLSRPGAPALLEPAPLEHWQAVTGRLSLAHLEEQCRRDNAFAAQYGPLLPRLQRRGERFVRDMAALTREGDCLSLTHGDLQTAAGDHVRRFRGRPMVIDWGFAQRAPFYIDLVDFFSREEALLYWQAMARQGQAPSREGFLERWQAASPYPGFIYLYPALAQYRRGDPSRLERLLALLLHDA